MGIWYNGGTIAVENGSASVVGTTTLFMTKAKDGDTLLTMQSGTLRLNQVASRADDNNLTLEPPWEGTTESGLAYYIIPTSPDWGEVSEVAHDLANFLANQATFFPTDGKPSDDEGGDGSFAVDPNSTPPKLYVKSAGSWDDGTSLGGPTGATGAGYGGTSTDSKTLAATGSMAFNTQTGLAWQSGNRIRVSSAAAVATKWMEGVITDYSAGVLTITIDKQGSGSGSASDWKFGPAGEPGVKGDTPKFSGTSTDSKTIATGSLTVATQSDLAFAIGSRVTLASAANSANFMSGLVTAYSAGSMTINVDLIVGSGTFSDWVITLVGARGATGATGLGYGGTSTTSRSINNTGTMTWTIGTGKAYQVGDLVKIVVTADATQWMKGIVSGYSAGVLSVDINEKGPASTGTFASWNIGLAGETGEQGPTGADSTVPGPAFNPTGDYDSGTAYAKYDVVLDQDSSWVALQATTGNAPPTLPTTNNIYWQLLALKGTDGTGTVASVNGLLPSTGNVSLDAGDVPDSDDPSNYTPTSETVQGHLQGIDTAIGSIGFPSSPQGRLTLTSGVSITTTDVSGVTSIYYTPTSGLYVPIFDGSFTRMTSFGAELTLPLDSNSGHSGYHQSGKIFDLFIINDAGTIRLVTGPAWSSDTDRGTGSGTTELELKNGVYTNKQTMLARFGTASGNTVSVPSNQALYVGSFRATADGQASDTQAQRFLFNAYNQAKRILYRTDATASWNYSTATFRQANADNVGTANKFEWLTGLPGQWLDATVGHSVTNSTSTPRQCYVDMGLNSTTVPSSTSGGRNMAANNTYGTWSFRNFNNYVPLGYSYMAWLEKGNGTDTQQWYGASANGIAGSIWA